MPLVTLHPATRLIVWLLLLIAVQCLSGMALAAAFVVPTVLGTRVLTRAARLVWRTRWLLVSLLVIFAWGVAGDPLWAGPLAPTFQGLAEALTHLGRLLLVLIAVAAFLETMPLADLLAATHALFGPLRRLGTDPDRAVVRLMLVLRYAETLPRARDWRSLLVDPPVETSQALEVQHAPLRLSDVLIVICCAGAVVMLCLHAGL